MMALIIMPCIIDSTLVVLSGNETIEESVARSFRVILKKSENKNLSEMHIGKTAFSLMKLKILMSVLVKNNYKAISAFHLNMQNGEIY